MGWDGLGRGMVVTGSGVLWRERLDGRDARGEPREIVLKMTWKVWTCPWGRGVGGAQFGNKQRRIKEQPTKPGLEKWPLKRVCLCCCCCFSYNNDVY